MLFRAAAIQSRACLLRVKSTHYRTATVIAALPQATDIAAGLPGTGLVRSLARHGVMLARELPTLMILKLMEPADKSRRVPWNPNHCEQPRPRFIKCSL